MRIAVVTCYFDPDYVRARVLRAAIAGCPDTEVLVVKNRHRGMFRYIEMIWKIADLRLRHRPDVYVLTFRGQEMLPIALMLKGSKPLIFDEFIVPLAWANAEKHKGTPVVVVKKLLARLSASLYKRWLAACHLILTDTEVHADISAELSGINRSRYVPIPVSTDETVFFPRQSKTKENLFQVFYYGNMLPLHGLAFVLAAAEELVSDPTVLFVIAGGGHAAQTAIESAKGRGARIEYHSWIAFDEIPHVIAESNLCLAGPFGNTPQGQSVITGKTYQFLASSAPTLVGESRATTLFRDKDNCLLVPQGDAVKLAEVIRWSVEHPDALAAIGTNGRRSYDDHFSVQMVTARLTPVLDQYRRPPVESPAP